MKQLTIKELVEQFAELDKMLKEHNCEAYGSYEVTTRMSGYRVMITISEITDNEDED